MKHYETWFCIADVPICMVTPWPLSVEPQFAQYRGGPADNGVICVFEPMEKFPAPHPGSSQVFYDGMHRIFCWEQGAQQYFTIPFAGVPQNRRPDLYHEMENPASRHMRLYFRPDAAPYFATAMGCFNAAKIERLLLPGKRLVLHASYIGWQGSAIAFTANSGVGKSTQAALWQRFAGAEIINGDRLAFGMKEGHMTAFGLPVAGSSGIFTNKALPIRAVVLLGRDRESRVRPASAPEALRDILAQVTVNRWDSQFMGEVTDQLTALLERVKIFRLLATPDEAAVRCLMGALEQEKSTWNP